MSDNEENLVEIPKKAEKFDIRKMPALLGYITRLGAQQLNFRRYQIVEKEGGHYYSQKVLIKLNNDGEVSCSKDGYDPTPEEASAIQRECRNVDWPKSIMANAAKLRELRSITKGNPLFPFYSRNPEKAGANIIMCQERIDTEDGGKRYVPWSYFNIGGWIRMEPDDKLPFYKPEKAISNYIMVHEGAKSADAAAKIAEAYERGDRSHPWGETLSRYEHWGIIGGALAVERADFSELKNANVAEVVFFCDNDDLGKESLRAFSKNYGKKMARIFVDDSWPKAWDVADPIPDVAMSKGKYIGRPLEAMISPATWATEEIDNPDGRKKAYRISSLVAEDWYHSIKPRVFVYKGKPNVHYTEDEFNAYMKRFAHKGVKVADLMGETASNQVDCLGYNPSEGQGAYTSGVNRSDGTRVLNTHIGGNVKSLKGDPSPWIEYLNYLFPDPLDVKEVQRWIATFIARPDIKMGYGILLVGGQGVGKSTLGSYILAPLIGKHNVSYPDNEEIKDNRYTTWKAQKRLAFLHEVYGGETHAAYNNLKSVITETEIEVKEKYKTTYLIENYCHIIACSNSEFALKLEDEDRRWLVPRLVDKDKAKPDEWWIKFHKWLNEGNGLGIIKWWCEQFLKDNQPVLASSKAPETDRKKSMIENMMSDGKLLIKDELEELRKKYPGEDLVIILDDLVEYIKFTLYDGVKNDRIERPLTIKKLAKTHGWYASEGRIAVSRVRKAYLISTNKDAFKGTWSEIKAKNTHIGIHQPSNKQDGKPIVTGYLLDKM